MIRRFVPALLLAGTFALAACSGGQVNLPGGGSVNAPSVALPDVNLPGVTIPSGIPTSIGDGIGMQLQAQGFEPNADKTEYTKKGAGSDGDVTIVMGPNGPTNIKYNNALLNCKPTTQSVINGAAASALGNTNDEVAKQFCAV